MRRVSAKRRKLLERVRPIRSALVEGHPECMICEASPRHPHRGRPAECSQLCCHEIANGPYREKALDKPYAILVLCWYCNGEEVTDKQEWPESRQLALLRECSPESYDLAAYNALRGVPGRITQEDVDNEAQRIR